MSGGTTKVVTRCPKKLPKEQNPKKGSGVFEVNSLKNGYGLLSGTKPCSWGLANWRSKIYFAVGEPR
jgi:hypothetical protein